MNEAEAILEFWFGRLPDEPGKGRGTQALLVRTGFRCR